jgi:two-component system, sensor histidine kinase and response regulator
VIEQIVGLRVLACGRQTAARETLQRLFSGHGARVDQASDPAAALSMAASAAASGDVYGLVAVDGCALQAGDIALYQRVCELFGAPKIPLLLIGGAESAAEGVVFVDDLSNETALWNAVAQASGGQVSGAGPVVAPPAPPRKIRILLAEDNEVNQLVAVGMLNSLGYASEVVPNGAEAVAAMEHGGFDLVLMDVRMPVMDGLEATRRIRMLGGPAGGVPIIAVTANAMRGDEEACLNAGMNDYLAKPIRLAVLDAAIKRRLKQK